MPILSCMSEIAEAVTLSGQLIIQYIGNQINDFLNDAVGTKKVDYVIYSDTDSVYLNMEAIVKKFGSNKTKDEIINYINNIIGSNYEHNNLYQLKYVLLNY